MDRAIVDRVLRALPLLLEQEHLSWDYDKEADVLYVTFERAEAVDTDLTDDDIVVHFRTDNNEIVGITVLHASQRDGLKLRPD